MSAKKSVAEKVLKRDPHLNSTPALEKPEVTLHCRPKMFAMRFRITLGFATVVAILFAASAWGQSTSTIRGGWSATVGPNQILQGTWTADLAPANPNSAQGSWTLLNQSNQIAARGTWSAAKTEKVWSGSWQARVVTAAGATGRLFSGSWRTEISDVDVRSLIELLEKTLREQVSGSWTSGRLGGAWSLRSYR